MKINKFIIIIILFSFLTIPDAVYSQESTFRTIDNINQNQLVLNNGVKDIPRDISINWLIQSITTQTWSSAWIDSSRSVFEHNQNGNLKEMVYQIKQNNEWQNYTRSRYEYSNGRKSLLTMQEWINDEWQNSKQISYSYSNVGQLTTRIIKNWQNEQWSEFQQEKYYYGNDRLKDSLIIEVKTDDKWIKTYKSVYKYGQNSNRIYTGDMFWQGEKWVKASESFSTYNEQNQKIQTIEKK